MLMKNEGNLHNKIASIVLIIFGLFLIYATISVQYLDSTIRTFLICGILITLSGIFLFIKTFLKKKQLFKSTKILLILNQYLIYIIVKKLLLPVCIQIFLFFLDIDQYHQFSSYILVFAYFRHLYKQCAFLHLYQQIYQFLLFPQ